MLSSLFISRRNEDILRSIHCQFHRIIAHIFYKNTQLAALPQRIDNRVRLLRGIHIKNRLVTIPFTHIHILHAADSAKFLYKLFNICVIVSLPPYSPDLNPIEQVWRVTRREKTHNRYWSRLPKSTAVLDEWFGSFSEPNEKLASLYSFAW